MVRGRGTKGKGSNAWDLRKTDKDDSSVAIISLLLKVLWIIGRDNLLVIPYRRKFKVCWRNYSSTEDLVSLISWAVTHTQTR